MNATGMKASQDKAKPAMRTLLMKMSAGDESMVFADMVS